MFIPKVRYQLDSATGASLCIVDDLSDELKELIRSELTKICHGVYKAESGRKSYSYEKTLAEFIRRYDDKSTTTKLGMMGELLCHLMIFKHDLDIKPASPFFNMEEASIKKGFDIILAHATISGLWLAEVKAGELGKNNVNQKTRILIDKARDDLIERLGSDNTTIWHSAINNVEISLGNGKSEKKILVDLLEDCLDASSTKNNTPTNINVILVPVLFESTLNEIDLAVVTARGAKINEGKIFASCKIFAIQKSTAKKIEKFIYDEVGL